MDEVDDAWSHVVTAERLLHEMLATMHQNILHPIWVSLKRETSCPQFSGFLRALSSLRYFVFIALVLR
jgi:hypothetical protein